MNISTATQIMKKVPVLGIILSAMLIRSILIDPSYPLALISIGLMGLYAFRIHLEATKVPEVNKKIQTEVSELRSTVNKLSDSVSKVVMSSGIKRLDNNEQKKRIF